MDRGGDNRNNVSDPEDEVCKSCIGAMYLSKSMREAGIFPICFGVKANMVGKKITVANQELLEQRKNNDDVDTFLSIGYSVFTPRMERRGVVPICLVGMQFIAVSKEIDRPQAVEGSKRVSVSPGESVSEEKQQQQLQSTRDTPGFAPSELLRSIVTATSLGVGKGVDFTANACRKQFDSMVKFYRATAKDFPSKFARSSRKLAHSCGKTLGYIVKRVEKSFKEK